MFQLTQHFMLNWLQPQPHVLQCLIVRKMYDFSCNMVSECSSICGGEIQPWDYLFRFLWDAHWLLVIGFHVLQKPITPPPFPYFNIYRLYCMVISEFVYLLSWLCQYLLKWWVCVELYVLSSVGVVGTDVASLSQAACGFNGRAKWCSLESQNVSIAGSPDFCRECERKQTHSARLLIRTTVKVLSVFPCLYM